jgi:ureidoglycolate hydrolase
MDENLLEIREFIGIGFMPLIFFGNWRVAILRYIDEIRPDNIHAMERHVETDEVFVLMKGKGILVIGGNGPQVDEIYLQTMEPGIIFNVKCNTWHTTLLSRDASVLIVENHDTGEQNSEYASLTAELHRQIVEAAAHTQIE